MTRQEQAYTKINMLRNKIVELREFNDGILNEKERLHYYYMDNIDCDGKKLSKEMNRLQRLYEKNIKDMERYSNEINRLCRKYSISI